MLCLLLNNSASSIVLLGVDISYYFHFYICPVLVTPQPQSLIVQDAIQAIQGGGGCMLQGPKSASCA